MIGVLRRIAGLWPARAVLKSRWVEPLVAAVLRASPVEERGRFLARELRGRPVRQV